MNPEPPISLRQVGYFRLYVGWWQLLLHGLMLTITSPGHAQSGVDERVMVRHPEQWDSVTALHGLPGPTRDLEGTRQSVPARVDVELDIFSGKPNPRWVLPNPEADSFARRLAKVPPGVATDLSGNLGYRGFIVQMTQGADTQVIRIQAGRVQISRGLTKVYATGDTRELERWLLNTGKPHLRPELLQSVRRELN